MNTGPVLAGQSDPLFEPASMLITTPTLSIEIPAQEKLLQKYKERVERLSQQNRVIKICLDAGFLKTVEVGKYFMTKHTDEFLQFTEPVTCREYILPRDEKSTDPKGWIRGNIKIGPVLEVTTSYLQGKCRVEIRIESVNKDNSHSRVRISHGLKKLVTDLGNNKDDDNEQETSEMQFEDFALKTNVLSFASRSKAKAKPRRRTSACSSTRTVPICERSWTDIEPETCSLVAYPVSKQLSIMDNYLEKKMERSNSGDSKIFIGTKLSTLNIGLLKCGRAKWQDAEATRKDFNIVLTRQDKKLFISELFKVIQDAIPFRTMCLFQIISSSTFLILDVQSVYTLSQIQD